ncbi:STAS domain-containing protein [Streptomyces sp. NPDC006662]|uniref:STAS domain-containing protein n=1 Tax=Streptomyces sp. NPDC006662 TaxID=3156902 RepID=UPI0033C7E25D
MITPQVTVQTNDGGVLVVACSGDFDMDTTNLLGEACSRLAPGEPLVVDATQVSFADSSFLNALIQLQNNRPLALQGPLPDQLRRLMEMTGSLTLFAIRHHADPAG